MPKKRATLGEHIAFMERSMYHRMDHATRIKFRCVKSMAEPDLDKPDPKSVLFLTLTERVNTMWNDYRDLQGFFRDASEAVHAEAMAELLSECEPTYLDLVE